MLNITPFGWFHTAISLVSLFGGLYALLRYHDIRYATPEQGASIGKETTELDPVIALIFGQQGLIEERADGIVLRERLNDV